MEEKHIFVGIDLGDKNSVARIAENLKKSERFGFVNSRAGRRRLFSEVRKRADQAGGARIWMAYEASACGFVLRDEAVAAGIDCLVLAPTKMEKSLEQRKHKNDDRDAEDVVEKLKGHVLAGNRLPKVWVPEPQVRDDRELIRMRLEVAEKITKVKSQVQMLLKRQGVEKPAEARSSWTIRYRSWLNSLTQWEKMGSGARQALSSLLRQLQALEEELQRLDEPIQHLAEQERHKPFVEALTQECGVGVLTALVYRTEIGYAGRFERGRQVGKFVGLTPTSHESGQQQDRKGHISRQGPPRVRKLLCQACWVLLLHDIQARRIYDELVKRNPKKKKIAIVALMRRMAVRLWHRMRAVEMKLAAVKSAAAI